MTHQRFPLETEPQAMYDVALSFAGEDRDYVEKVAAYLKSRGLDVFYDAYERVDLWGKDLYEHLSNVYKDQSHFVVMFVSKHYAAKIWTTHERRSAQARALVENSEYILPARFDDTEVPGLLLTTGYIDLRGMDAAVFAELIVAKVKGAHFWSRELVEVVDFCDRVLIEAHRGAFLWRHDVTAVFDNRLSDTNDAYLVALGQSCSNIPLLARTEPGQHPIVTLYQSSDAFDLHETVWRIYGQRHDGSNLALQKSIADRVTGSVRYQPVKGPRDVTPG